MTVGMQRGTGTFHGPFATETPLTEATPPARSALRVAYLVNQYPKASHTFIRREIQALERCGVVVERVAIRGWAEAMPDPVDIEERNQTRYVLQAGVSALFLRAIAFAACAPLRFAAAFRLAWRSSFHADRPVVYHLIYLAEACRVAGLARSAGCSHVHAHFGTNSAEVAMLAGELGGLTFSFTAHGPEEFDKATVLGLPEKIRRAAFVVAVSSFGRSQLFRWSSASDWPRIHVVHCGLDGRFYDVADIPPPSAARFVCVGRLSEQKGQMLLLEAMKRLVDRNLAVELVLAGDGEMRPDIEARIKQLGLGTKVRITGWIDGDRVRSEIQAARALVLPSFAEGLPVVLMEAMALRRPVISTFVAGIPELVRTGEEGWLVPAGDVQALADAMQSCAASSAAELEAMGARAQTRALERHDVDTEARKLMALFLQVRPS